MQRPFEQLAPSNYRDRRARLARLREVVGEILGPHWEVHVKPGRRRIHLVCGESKPPCEMNVTLWAHLWIDHLLGWARRWGHIAIFAAFKGEGRHKALKCEISKRSFRGGSKGGRVSRLRGARVRVKGGNGDRTRKGWGEVIRSDNLDWGLYSFVYGGDVSVRKRSARHNMCCACCFKTRITRSTCRTQTTHASHAERAERATRSSRGRLRSRLPAHAKRVARVARHYCTRAHFWGAASSQFGYPAYAVVPQGSHWSHG